MCTYLSLLLLFLLKAVLGNCDQRTEISLPLFPLPFRSGRGDQILSRPPPSFSPAPPALSGRQGGTGPFFFFSPASKGYSEQLGPLTPVPLSLPEQLCASKSIKLLHLFFFPLFPSLLFKDSNVGRCLTTIPPPSSPTDGHSLPQREGSLSPPFLFLPGRPVVKGRSPELRLRDFLFPFYLLIERIGRPGTSGSGSVALSSFSFSSRFLQRRRHMRTDFLALRYCFSPFPPPFFSFPSASEERRWQNLIIFGAP